MPGGTLADRFGAKRLLLVSLMLWSVFTALTGAMWGFGALIVVRTLFGVAQALFPGTSFKALAERTTPDRRATAAGWMLATWVPQRPEQFALAGQAQKSEAEAT